MSLPSNPIQRSLQALVFGFFVFAFLYFFQPFQIDQTGSHLFAICAGFGLVTTVAMLILNVVLPKFFTAYFEEKNWKVWKEIFWTLINMSCIGLANHIYFLWYQDKSFHMHGLWWFQMATWAVGVFPVSLFILIKEQRARSKYQNLSSDLSIQLKQESEVKLLEDEVIQLESQNQTDVFKAPSNHLILIVAAENYIEIHYTDGDAPRKKLLRMTLKAATEALAQYPVFFRCHKSYLVNVYHVIDVSGNAQGYRLHLKNFADPVPVSRQFNSVLKNKLTIRP